MNFIIKKIISFILCFFIISCTTNINKFSNYEPKLDLFNYFDGKTVAWGIFEDRFGNIQKQFKVNIIGTIKNDYLILDEKFIYKNGEKERRIWNIKKVSENSYLGTAKDIAGIAKGVSKGNALNWNYNMNIKIRGINLLVHFDDWMFLQENNILINKAKVSKWGINIGEVSLFFRKIN